MSAAIAPFAPLLDRESIRAIVFPRGPWPRDTAALGERVGAAVGRQDLRWAEHPEERLLSDLPPGRIAVPALAPPSWGPALRSRVVYWMDAAPGGLDPGLDQVRQALDAGVVAVLSTPLSGDLLDLPAVEALCRSRGTILIVDARRSAGSRTADRQVGQFGDRVLLTPDGEPPPSICPGAFVSLPGASDAPLPVGRHGRLRSALWRLLLDEPRLRSWLPHAWTAAELDEASLTGPIAPWNIAAAAARLQQSPHRAAQRARVLRELRAQLGNLPRAELVPLRAGTQPAVAALPVLVERLDPVVGRLHREGMATRQGFAVLLAPEEEAPVATNLVRRLLWVPVHPFFRSMDLRRLAEALRRAVLHPDP